MCSTQSWSIWKVENQACTFLARSDLKKPSSRLAYIIGDSVKPKTRENINAELKLRYFSLTILDSLCGMMRPLFDTTITNIKLATHGGLHGMNAVLISSIVASTFNAQLEAWEPLVEPFDGIFKFETFDANAQSPFGLGKRIRISATSILNVNGCVKMSSSLISDFLHQTGGTAIIDGGLATELERHGADLNDPLWSAKCLISTPQSNLIRQVHLDYLENGADIITTASYQATIQGFKEKGFSDKEGENMLRRSVEIACEARDLYYERCAACSSGDKSDGRILKKRTILIAASVGSYGAYLADGSEYSGIYGDAITLATLKDFHRRRVQILADSGADLLAFETIPNKIEAQAYVELLEEENIKIPAWFCFNSKDGINVVSGDSLVECGSIAESCKKVVAVGINCTPPRFIHDLILLLKKVTTKPIAIYPNSGETYDGDRKEWVQNTGVTNEDFVSYVSKWCELGACLIGGCCRTTPVTIRGIYKTLYNSQSATLATK